MVDPGNRRVPCVGAAVLVAAVCLTGVALAGDEAPQAAPATEDAAEPVDWQRLAARWSRKSASERRLLRQRYEILRSMDAEERRQLVERARATSALQARLLARAPADLRAELESLTPEERERRERRYLLERTQEIGRRLRPKLPAPFVAELERARPEERLFLFERFRREQQRDKALRAIVALARALELGPAEIDRLRALEPEERPAVLRSLRRRHVEAAVAEQGLPAGLEEEEWERLRGLSDEAFLEALRGIELPSVRHDGSS